MHVSPFSDAMILGGSDRAALAHRDGLLRGLAVLGIFVLLIGLTCLGNAMHPADADAATVACRPIARTTPVVASHACWLRGPMPQRRPVNLRP